MINVNIFDSEVDGNNAQLPQWKSIAFKLLASDTILHRKVRPNRLFLYLFVFFFVYYSNYFCKKKGSTVFGKSFGRIVVVGGCRAISIE
jgi:hypothetical protein